MKMSNKNKGEEEMKKILILLILTLIAITSCIDLSLNAGSKMESEFRFIKLGKNFFLPFIKK